MTDHREAFCYGQRALVEPAAHTEVASGKALDTLEAAPEEVESTVGRQKLRSRIEPAVLSLSRGDFAMAS
jgi:hypothetical protein